MLEPPCQGCSNEYPKSIFLTKTNNFAQNIECGYSLEPPCIDCGYMLELPCQGGSNEYPQSIFGNKNRYVTQVLQ